jgi:hypothetical protein
MRRAPATNASEESRSDRRDDDHAGAPRDRETCLGDGHVEALPRGWYVDPSRRWRARYWDGTRWTEQVANPGVDATQPQYGSDPFVGQTERDEHEAGRVDASHSSELDRLRAEADRWREIAEDRQRALDAVTASGDERDNVDRDAPTQPSLEQGATRTEDAHAKDRPTDDYVEVPPDVREAAMNELATVKGRGGLNKRSRRRKRR